VASRLEFQALLQTLLGTGNVYFQPPHTFSMVYPCIVYSLSDIDAKHADNDPYILTTEYSVIYISRDPDDSAMYALARVRSAKFGKTYVSDGLNHTVFNIPF